MSNQDHGVIICGGVTTTVSPDEESRMLAGQILSAADHVESQPTEENILRAKVRATINRSRRAVEWAGIS